MRRTTLFSLALALTPLAAQAGTDLMTKRVLSLGAAKQVAAAAELAAARSGSGGAIAIVDDGGHVLVLERLDGTFPAAPEIAAGKARSAATFRKPTADFEKAISGGRTALLANPPLLPLQGGVPIVVDGQVVGAVGVAGASSAEADDAIARQAAGALAAPARREEAVVRRGLLLVLLLGGAAAPVRAASSADQVTFLPAAALDAAFAKGQPLTENPEFKVHASRRTGPGQVEVHRRDTDVIHVLEGTATLVSGGRALELREVAPDELRGRAIEGGDVQRLAKGDLAIVPRGVPHWFREASAPFLYYVVKVSGEPRDPGAAPQDPPLATIDLSTRRGVELVRGQWRYGDARVVETRHRAPAADGDPTGAPTRTWDTLPRAGAADFDDSGFEKVDPTTLGQRRGTGRLCFGWYRIRITIPDRIGVFDPSGSTVVFQTTADDYAEVWVDGELPRALGQRGGSAVAGWNAPNRLVIARNARPGQRIVLAVFAANGPLSDPPANFLWLREARLEFLPGDGSEPFASGPSELNLWIERTDAGLDAVLPPNPKLWRLAEGFQFTEGPVWTGDGLLFSDPNANRIYRYTSDGRLAVFREKSGYDGADIGAYRQPGSNGLALDPEGRLTVDQHGRRRVVRLEADGRETVLADRYEGRRLNSPNDLVWRSDGTLFFTDPPFGLPQFGDDPRKELPWSGVFAWRDGRLRLLTRELAGPNGLALSPDERLLYVGDWNERHKVVMRWDVALDGTLSNGRVFFDMTGAPGEEAIDGIKVDRSGNLFVSGPGGLWVLSPDGRHLGTLHTPKHVHNLAWGDDDGRTLYLAAQSELYRLRVRTGRPERTAAGLRTSTSQLAGEEARWPGPR